MKSHINIICIFTIYLNLYRFVSAYTSNTLVPRAFADIGLGIVVPYPIGDDGCPSLINGYCPVYEKEVLLYRFALPIAGFPQVDKLFKYIFMN